MSVELYRADKRATAMRHPNLPKPSYVYPCYAQGGYGSSRLGICISNTAITQLHTPYTTYRERDRRSHDFRSNFHSITRKFCRTTVKSVGETLPAVNSRIDVAIDTPLCFSIAARNTVTWFHRAEQESATTTVCLYQVHWIYV